MRFRIKSQKSRVFLLIVFVTLFPALSIFPAQNDREQKNEKNGPENNTLCYTCHLGLQNEEITAKHAVKEITCTSCHGLSVEHMYDEMQVTKPDQLFGRGEVEGMCGTCHEGHKNVEEVDAFRKKWLGKTRSNGRLITKTSICTDCHGTHNYIVKKIESNSPESDWASLFSGSNLKGWDISDGSTWSVDAGHLTAVPRANKQQNTIVTKDEYADFQMSITFRANWPVSGWISLRQLDSTSGPSVAIYDSSKPPGLPGSIWLPGKKLALANLRKSIVDRLTWNTMLIEAKQNEYSTWLNGQKIGSVHIDGPSSGKIAVEIAEHLENKESRLQISEIYIKLLDEPSEKSEK